MFVIVEHIDEETVESIDVVVTVVVAEELELVTEGLLFWEKSALVELFTGLCC
jgi:hypothetical protein